MARLLDAKLLLAFRTLRQKLRLARASSLSHGDTVCMARRPEKVKENPKHRIGRLFFVAFTARPHRARVFHLNLFQTTPLHSFSDDASLCAGVFVYSIYEHFLSAKRKLPG